MRVHFLFKAFMNHKKRIVFAFFHVGFYVTHCHFRALLKEKGAKHFNRFGSDELMPQTLTERLTISGRSTRW